jgi:tail protein P2 I
MPAIAPDLDDFADRFYYSVAPLAWLDADNGYALAYYCGAMGEMFEPVEDVARDTPEGPGWSAVVDLERCPDDWLPWLAQFVGVTVVAGSTPDAMRARIASTDGFKRGKPDAIRAAAAAHLTDSKTVILQERLGGDPYALGVYTIASETPSQAQTLADILAQKPGGIVLTYSAGAINTYEAVRIGYATYAAVTAHFSDYAHLAANRPDM